MKTAFYISLFILTSSLFVGADTISIRADNWCPYNCDPTHADKGYMVEFLEEIMTKKGHKIDYQLMPWADALKSAADGKTSGVVGAAAGELEKGMITDQIGSNNNCVFVTKKSDFKYTRPDDLKGKKLGLIQDYTYSPDIMDYVKKNPSQAEYVTADDPLKLNIKKLISGKIDVIVENEDVFNYYLEKNRFSGIFKSAGCTAKDQLYIAFSGKEANSAKWVKEFNEGLNELRNSGKLKQILSKYKVNDWK